MLRYPKTGRTDFGVIHIVIHKTGGFEGCEDAENSNRVKRGDPVKNRGWF